MQLRNTVTDSTLKQPVSPVLARVCDLLTAIGVAEEALMTLDSRLQIVSANYPQGTTGPDKNPTATQCDLAEQLVALLERIRAHTDKIQFITSRLEI